MNTLRLTVLSSALLILTGCISAPPYEGPPQTELGKQWTVQDSDVLHVAGNTYNQSLDAWWTRFNDPILDRLIAEGMAYNHDVRYAALKVEEARAALAGTRSDLWPSVDLEAGSARSRNSESVNPGGERYQTSNSIGAAINWELDLFGRIRHSIAADEARFEMLREDAQAINLSITTEIARSYFSLRSVQGELLAQQSIIESLETTRKIVARRVQAGDLPRVEIQTIDARLIAAKAVIPDIQARIRAYALALSILSGGLPEKELSLINSASQQMTWPAIPAGERADILRRRPDILAAERQLAASAADVGYAVAEQFPKLTINATGGFESLSSTQLLKAANQTWSLLPSISWRIFDGGRIKAEIHAAQARQEMAALAYEQTVLTSLNEAETAMGNYHYHHQAVIQWEDAAVTARQILQSQQRRFRAGDVAMADVLEAQRQFAEAQYSLAVARGNATNTMVNVIKALGGGMQKSSQSLG